MLTTLLTRVVATLLSATGFTLLFAADKVIPRLVTGAVGSGAWVGQLLGAALIALAWLNWFNRHALLGGIYGRSTVMPNAIFFFVGALSVLRAASRSPTASTAQWVIGATLGLFASAYVWLLYRGPIESDFARYRRESGGL